MTSRSDWLEPWILALVFPDELSEAERKAREARLEEIAAFWRQVDDDLSAAAVRGHEPGPIQDVPAQVLYERVRNMSPRARRAYLVSLSGYQVDEGWIDDDL